MASITDFDWKGGDNYQVDQNHGYQLCRMMTLSEEFYWRAYTADAGFLQKGTRAECIQACRRHFEGE